MTVVDWAIVGIVVLSVVTAAVQGFFFEVFATAGAVAGYLLAAWEYPWVAARLRPYVKEGWMADLAGFLAIFFGVLLLGGFAGRIARWVVRKAGLSFFDRLLGAAFGLVRGVVTVGVLVMALAAFAPGSKLLDRSELADFFLVAARGLSWVAPASVRQKVQEGAEVLRRAGKPSGQTPAKPVKPADF